MSSVTESVVYGFESFRVDAGKRLLWNGGEPVPLTPKVFDTLVYLVQNPGKAISKDELMAAIWPDTVVEENNLNKNISALRQLLGERPGEHRFIATIPGRGYKFVATVVESAGNGNHADITPSDGTGAGSVSLGTATPGKERRANFLYLRYGLAAAFAIVLTTGALRLWQAGRSHEARAIRSIAVLPFKPISADSRNEAMEFGMADSLITQLSQGNDLVVPPSSATRRYAATDRDPAQVGRALGVDAILDGTIQVAGDRVRITTRLIRSSDAKQMWAANFDEPMRDVFAVQDSITERVATVLNAKLAIRSRKHYTEDVDSYELFLLGRYTALKLTPQDHFKAVEYFRKAIEKDSKYALAYTGITGTYTTYSLASDASPALTMPEAKAAAIKAVELDDELPEAHVALGKIDSMTMSAPKPE